MVFMGDTGSLSMGGTIGAIGCATKHELILTIIGGIFVLEALSVFAQVISFKLTGKEFLEWRLFIIILNKKVGQNQL